MTKAKFLQRDWSRFSRLGRRKKSKQKWRRPTGRDNKMREKRRGYPVVVSIGYRQKAKDRNKIDGKEVITIFNIDDLTKVGKNTVVHLGKVGDKKKAEIVKKALEMKIKIINVNEKKFQAAVEKKKKEKAKKKAEVKSADKEDKKSKSKNDKKEVKEKTVDKNEEENKSDSKKEKVEEMENEK